MKKMGKYLALALAITMVVAVLLSGCNQTGGDGTKKIVWYTFGTKQADHDKVVAAVNEKLKEKLGVELDYKVIEGSAYEQKINLAVSAGEVFDICFTANWMNNFNNNAAKGAYLEITDELLQNNAPSLRGKYPDFFFDGGLYDGKLYAIPNYQMLALPAGVSLRQEFVDKYNFDINSVKELKDIEPFLAAVKEGEPNIFPLNPRGIDPFWFKFAQISSQQTITFDKADDSLTVLARCETPYAMELLEFWADWYDKGYIRKDLLTSKDDTDNDIINNKYAVLTGGIKPGGDGDNKLKTGKDYKGLPVAEAEINTNVSVSTMLAISKTTSDPDMAMKFIDLLHTDKEIYNMLLFGLQDEHYTVKSEDPTVVEVPTDSKYSMSATNGWTFGSQFNAFYRTDQTPGAWEESDAMNRSTPLSKIYGFTFVTDSVKTQIAQASAVYDEYDPERIYARTGWKEAYNEYVQKTKAAGVDDIVKEAQKQLDEWKATR